jgi:HTH-type transcriptional regulator/antitoxin HigA
MTATTRAPLLPIRSPDEHRAALAELSAYFDNEPEPGTYDGDRFEVLLAFVESYEAKRFPIDLPDPVESIKIRLEQSCLIANR